MDLACRRGGRLLFRGLGFEVGAGQIVWLRGRNGRGKTSLLRLAAGLATPDQGRIVCDGSSLVFVAHTCALKDDLSVVEALEFLLRVHRRPCDRPTVHTALARLGLHERRHALVRTLSQGQRRRVALARLAVEDRASLWLLDEPFDSLDADGMSTLHELLREHAARGGGVLLTSHQGLDTHALQAIEIDLDLHG